MIVVRRRHWLVLGLVAACGGPEPGVVGTPRAGDARPDAGPVAGVRFVGNVDVGDAELEKVSTWSQEPTPETPREQLLKLDAESILSLYVDRGNLDATVKVADVVRDGAGKITGATFVISEGKRYKIGAFRVDAHGTHIAGVEHEVLPRFESTTGGLFLRKQIRADLDLLARAYQDDGYVAVSVEPELTLHPENGTADIMVQLHAGTRATFDDVSVIGNHTIPLGELRKAFTFKEGDSFSQTKFEQTRQNLFDLFNKQGISAMRSLAQDTSHVVVQYRVYEPDWETPPPRPRHPCPAQVDAAALLEKHARAYGTLTAVRAALPRTFKGSVETEMRTGETAFYLDAKEQKLEISLGGVDPFRPARLPLGAGVDRNGSWELGLSGEVVRLGADVAVGGSFMGWLYRREYLTDAARKSAKAACRTEGDETHTELTFPGDPGEGVRRIELDPETGELTGFGAFRHGVYAAGKITTWGAAGADGVRWPMRLSVIGPIGNDLRFTTEAKGLSCGEAHCTAAMPARMTATWPAKGVVTVPFTFFENELFVRTKVNDTEVWAVLDSGASLTSLDTTAPLGAAQKPLLSLWARGSTQGLAYGVSEVSRVSIGDLTFRDMPVASAPLPVLASGGVMRAEAILGIALFQEGAVRVDYTKQQLTFARDASLLPPRAGRSMPTVMSWDMLSGNASIAGKTAVFQLDTGNGNGVNIEEPWAKEVGLPGALPTVQASALTGAGERVTLVTMFRVPKSTLGPVHYDDKLVQMNNNAPKSGLGGLIGNDLFARCDAVTFDPKAHTLTFHGACDRPRGEAKTGWHLEPKPDDQWKGAPWVVAAILPGTAADLAGVSAGDRLLEVDGKPASLDRATWNEIFYGPDGAKVPIVVARGSTRRTVLITLHTILK